MPRKKYEITKVERVQHISELLRSHKCMSKQDIDHKLSVLTGIPAKALKQSTYRDLRWMVDKGLVAVRHKLTDGTLVLDGEQRVREPYKSEWFLPDSIDAFVGAGLIASSNSKIFFSKRLSGRFKVLETSGGKNGPTNSVNLELRLGGSTFCLAIEVQALPAIVIIGRVKGSILGSQDDFLEKVEKEFGKRTIYLHLNSREVSSFRDARNAGHCSIEFDSAGQGVKVTDLSSTNRTFVNPKPTVSGSEKSTIKVGRLPYEIMAPQVSGAYLEFPLSIDCGGTRILVYAT